MKRQIVPNLRKEQRGFGKFDKLKSYAEAIQDRWDPQMVKQYVLLGSSNHSNIFPFFCKGKLYGKIHLHQAQIASTGYQGVESVSPAKIKVMEKYDSKFQHVDRISFLFQCMIHDICIFASSLLYAYPNMLNNPEHQQFRTRGFMLFSCPTSRSSF